MVTQQPVINTYIVMFVLQDFSAMAFQCAVTNKQNHEAFNWKKLPPLNKIIRPSTGRKLPPLNKIMRPSIGKNYHL
jgi:hypothetical protein